MKQMLNKLDKASVELHTLSHFAAQHCMDYRSVLNSEELLWSQPTCPTLTINLLCKLNQLSKF